MGSTGNAIKIYVQLWTVTQDVTLHSQAKKDFGHYPKELPIVSLNEEKEGSTYLNPSC